MVNAEILGTLVADPTPSASVDVMCILAMGYPIDESTTSSDFWITKFPYKAHLQNGKSEAQAEAA